MAEAQKVARFGLWEWIPAEDRVTWSDQLYRIFRVDPGEFAATFEAYIDRVHPDDREPVAAKIQKSLRTGEPYLQEHRIVVGDESTVRTLRCHGQAVTGADGQVLRMVGVCQDITELAEAEVARRAAELRFRNAFEHAPIGVMIVDLKGAEVRAAEANRAMAAITGLEPDAMAGMALGPLIAEPEREPDRRQRRRLLAGEGDTYQFESPLLHSEGHQIWCQICVSAAPDAGDGEPRGIVQVQDISERRRLEDRLRYLADHDSLTGLRNRRCFSAELQSAVAFTARYGRTGALLIIDIDELKAVNDSLGHSAGDDLLRRVAEILRDRTRETDFVARLSGDEFAILVPQAGADGARLLAEALRRGIGEVEFGSEAEPVTASIGIALFGAGYAEGVEAALESADRAMYMAKEGGGDRIALSAGEGE